MRLIKILKVLGIITELGSYVAPYLPNGIGLFMVASASTIKEVSKRYGN